MKIEIISQHPCFDGVVGFYRHDSTVNKCQMRFSVFVPAQVKQKPAPALVYLAGLTCTEETFMTKAGAHRLAAELGLVLIAPDTSPRGAGVPGAADGAWDFGLGAGFYLNATEPPFNANYQMYSYVVEELPSIIAAHFPVDMERRGVFGHSMGGHGALVIGLRNPDQFRSISAFAPIVAPTQVPWGQKAFRGYLGADQKTWHDYDATELIKNRSAAIGGCEILVDQGMSDQFLTRELKPELFVQACKDAKVALTLRQHPGFDHGYYFISTFIDDHLRWHAAALKR